MRDRKLWNFSKANVMPSSGTFRDLWEPCVCDRGASPRLHASVSGEEPKWEDFGGGIDGERMQLDRGGSFGNYLRN